MIYVAHSPTHELRKSFELTDDGRLIGQTQNPGDNFNFERREIRSLADVADLFRELADDPRRAIVMGKPRNDQGQRALHTFDPLPTRFWVIDIDGAAIEGSDQQTIETCLPFLAGHSYVYAYSQSAGLKDGLRVRVICQLTDKLDGPDLAAHARYYNDLLTSFTGQKRAVIDSNIYRPSGLIFTSRPRLINLGDPHPDRVHFVQGDDLPVTLDRLPDMIDVTSESKADVSMLPMLKGFGIETDGHDHSLNAYWGLRHLRSYMEHADNDHDWNDPMAGEELWHEMLTKANATPYEWREYAGFYRKRRNGIKPADDSNTIRAIDNPDNSVPLQVAEDELRSVLHAVVESAEPCVVGVKVSMGTGKTWQALNEIADERRARRAESPLGDLSVDWYTPTIETAKQTLETADDEGLDGFIEYGRGQEVGGRPVCAKHEAAGVISGLVNSTTEKICRNDMGNICDHYAGCRWQWQRNDSKAIPLRIRNHHHLPHVVRSEHNEAHREIDLVVIDEDFCRSLIRKSKVSVADLVSPTRGLPDDAFIWVQRFGNILRDGLTLGALIAADFTEDVCTMLIKAEEELAPFVDVNPSMSAEASFKAAQKADKRWLDYARVWRRLRDCVRSGSMNRIFHPPGQEFLVLNWIAEIKSIPMDKETGRPSVPVIIMSGTMDREIIEKFLPVDDWHEIDVQPHPDCHIRQSDLRGSKTEALYGSSPERIAKGETDKKKTKAAAGVRRLVKEAAESTVLITYMEFEELEGADAHFMATEGRNDFSEKDLTLYGRPQPSPYVVEDMTRAVYQDDPRPILSLKNYFPMRAVARRGEGYANTSYHPDPRAERLRWLVCEGEMMQALARSRYVRHPVQVTILNRTPLPIRIDEVVTRHRLHPDWSRLDKAKALPLSQNELMLCYPGIGDHGRTASREIADRAKVYHRDKAALLISYRRERQRGPAKRALVDGLEAMMELGKISNVELLDDPRNDWSVSFREIRDHLAREPLAFEQDDQPMAFEQDDLFEIGQAPDDCDLPRWVDVASLMQSHRLPRWSLR